MKIALDIDGVLADTSKIVKRKVSQKFGVAESSLVDTRHDYNNIYRLDDSEMMSSVNTYIKELFAEDAEVYEKAEEISGAWSASMLLKPVAYITRRPQVNGIAQATRKWLKDHCFYSAPIYFIEKGTCKSTKAKELGVDLLIEDSPHEIVSCHENGLKILAFSYPYNAFVLRDNPDIEAVSGWDEALKWLRRNSP